MELPPALRLAVDRFLEGTPLEQLRAASERLSGRYRSETRDGRLHLDDALAVKAYLAARLPATYAAIRASMSYVTEAAPDFAPTSLIDIGAGPGSVRLPTMERLGGAWDIFMSSGFTGRAGSGFCAEFRWYSRKSPGYTGGSARKNRSPLDTSNRHRH